MSEEEYIFVTRSELANHLGITTKAVSKLKKRGIIKTKVEQVTSYVDTGLYNLHESIKSIKINGPIDRRRSHSGLRKPVSMRNIKTGDTIKFRSATEAAIKFNYKSIHTFTKYLRGDLPWPFSKASTLCGWVGEYQCMEYDE